MRIRTSTLTVADIYREREYRELEGKIARGEIPEYVPEPLPDLSLMQQIALIQMSESHVKRALLSRMGEDAQARPDWHDYRQLVERGLAFKRPNDKWHSLTADGAALARKLSPILCQRYGVHLLLELAAHRYDISFRCSCGQWSTSVPKGRATNGNAAFRFERHLAKVQR